MNMKDITVLITGANFSNKGAQSMLFVTIDEIHKRYKDATILFSSSEKLKLENCLFEQLYLPKGAWKIAAGGMEGFINCIVRYIKDSIKYLLKMGESPQKIRRDISKLDNVNVIIDISGFAIGTEWGYEHNIDYVDRILFAKKKAIPYYICPQSVGNLGFVETYGRLRGNRLLNAYRELLLYPLKIFIREKEGIEQLASIGITNNVVLSPDLVLQNKGVDSANLFSDVKTVEIPFVKTNSIGIVPNVQCFNRGNKRQIMNAYKTIIEILIEKGKEIYIFRHSSEDLSICKEIYSLAVRDNIHLIDNDFSCLEYDEFVKQFDFIICSRYHGNVHAYKNCVPCILLGWAVKYKELAELLSQEEYCFDITDEKLKVDGVVDAVEKMCDRYQTESEMIRHRLESIQKDNCFDKALGVLDR